MEGVFARIPHSANDLEVSATATPLLLQATVPVLLGYFSLRLRAAIATVVPVIMVTTTAPHRAQGNLRGD